MPMRAAATHFLFRAIALLILSLSVSARGAEPTGISLAPVRHPGPPLASGKTTVNHAKAHPRKKLRAMARRRSRTRLNRMVRQIRPIQSSTGTELSREVELEPMDPFVGKPKPVMNESTDPSDGPFVGAQISLPLGQ